MVHATSNYPFPLTAPGVMRTSPTFIPLLEASVQGPPKDVKTIRTHIAVVLDKSGSMSSVLDATIQGFNGQVESILKEATGQLFLSLVTFSTHVNPVFFNRTPDRLFKLDKSNYKPEGWTALYDAVGYTIRRLENEAEDVDNSAFLVMIISDGYENRSRDFNAFQLSDLITRKQATGRWTFTYMGSNQDLSQVATALSIPFGNVVSWTNTTAGTTAAFMNNSRSTQGYLKSRVRGLTQSNSFYAGDTVTTSSVSPIEKKNSGTA